MDILQIGADEYEILKLINFIRNQIIEGLDPRKELREYALSVDKAITKCPWSDDRYLNPVLEDDEMLFYDWSTLTTEGKQAVVNPKEEEPLDSPCDPDIAAALQDMYEMMLDDPSLREFVEESSRNPEEIGKLLEMKENSLPHNSLKHDHTISDDFNEEKLQSKTLDIATQCIDDAYFDSYSFFDIHREMLSDQPRTDTYRNALEMNPSIIKDATVLDVGCGTGVLSMFAMRGGANRVYAIDGSKVMAETARSICAANGFGGDESGPITVIADKVENVLELDTSKLDRASTREAQHDATEKVDVLVSEWMGMFLVKI